MREILIRLEDELYEQCKDTELTEENEGFDFHIIKSVANGTVLPKGHGDLIDRKALLNKPYEKGGFVEWYDEIKYATSIIEADKEENE